LDGIFSTFANDFNAVPLNMYRNFRSKDKLLRMQNEIIRVLDPESMMPDDQIVGNEGEILARGFATSQQEAEHLADLMAGWIQDKEVPHSEIAVLVSRQPDLYADLLMVELEKRGIPYRNEQQLQDLSVEPVARLIVDYLLSLYGAREPKAWLRLMDQLIPFADEAEQADMRQDWQRFIKSERKQVELLDLVGDNRWPSAWSFVESFLNRLGISSLTALSPDYESATRLIEVIQETKARIEEQLKIEPDLIKALTKFSDDQAVRYFDYTQK
jgi:superfamily I DNA/RNA helicase